MDITQIQRNEFIGGADFRQIAASNNGCTIIHNADSRINGIPHLMDKPLKQSIRHIETSNNAKRFLVRYPNRLLEYIENCSTSDRKKI